MFRIGLRWIIFTIAIGAATRATIDSIGLAQNYRGEAVPVVQRVDPLEFSRFRFLTFVFGHEGPMDTPLPTPPVMGREYFAEADLFGIESAGSVRFELLDTGGRSLQTLNMWKSSDAVDDGEFYGFLTVPQQPFRVAVTGTTTNGTAIRAVLNTLFQPAATGPADTPALPPGIPANEATQLQNMVNAYRQEVRAQADRAAADHPGGLIALPRTVVSPISYEPLPSASSSMGMRLRYSIRFPTTQAISAMPSVFPAYPQADWRGTVTMKPLAGAITPAPQMVGAQSLNDVIVYQAAATYQAGVTYSFTVDMIPDFVFQGTQTGRFCIHEQKFTNRAVWNALIANTAAVPYSIAIRDTGTFATIPTFLPQKTFYDAFMAGGAFDCGPTPNIRF